MTVVSSLLASDLDPARLKARGAVMLRDFLAYAADGTLPPPPAEPAAATTTAGAPRTGQAGGAPGGADPLRAEFARRLRDTGLVVHEGYGSAGHPIDLAVEDPDHPGHVLVAVETDGPAYAAMRSTRDRDRLRGEQLGRLGWMHVRVWSTDLFRDPARDVSRVHAAVQQAVASRAAAVPVAADPTTPDPTTPDPTTPDPSVPARTTSDPTTPTVPASAPDPGTADPSGTGPTGPEATTQGPGGATPQAETFDEFVPTTDEGARQRRVRGRRGKRVIAPATHERTDAPTLDVPTQQTRDDTDAGWGEAPTESAYDRWLREQRPPHWGSD